MLSPVVFLFCFLGCKGGLDTSAKPPPRLYKITAKDLHGVDTYGTEHIWLVGARGSIYHSPDGGKNWKPQVSGTKDLLTSVEFSNEKTGWITGIYGIILKTEDGGQTWVRQNTGTENHLFDISIAGERKGWAVGFMGTILNTTDGGKTWKSQRENVDINFNAVHFVDSDFGWVVGEFGIILNTTDGGDTWKQQKPYTLFKNEDDPWADVILALYGVKFIDRKRGWVVGMEGVLLSTEDGGATWKDLGKISEYAYYSIDILSGSAWAVGKGGNYILSRDGGKTFQLINDVIKTRFWLHDVAFSSAKTGWVVGARGAVAQTQDGGETWKMLSGLTYDVPEFGLTDF
jgi:photosystem II stability/assembly factor-like uncharacterized protein